MTTEAQFLRTIIANPHNQAPRLVFADWLEERGDPWAKFIRDQTRFANDPDYHEARSTIGVNPEESVAYELLREHESDWVARCLNAPGFVGSLRCDWNLVSFHGIWWRQALRRNPAGTARTYQLYWWRGFPERLRVSADDLVSFHAYYLNSFPIWHLRLDSWGSYRQQMEEENQLGGIAEILAQYAGRILVVDVSNWCPVNGFTSQFQSWMARMGEAARPRRFTLRVCQPVMDGHPHSVEDRWQKIVASAWRSNVSILTQLEPRSAGAI